MTKRITNEEFVKKVFELIGDEYTFLEEYIDSRTKIKIRHNKCGFEWKVKPNGFLTGNRCPECSKKNNALKRTKTNEQFIQEVYDSVENEYVFLEEYQGADKKINCRHNECGYEWKIMPSSFLRGNRCPKCYFTKQTKTNEDFIEEVYNLVGHEYVFLEEYINAKTKIKCKHNKCEHEWMVKPHQFLKGSRCPKCSVKGVGKKTNQQFICEVHNLVGDEYIFLEEYINKSTKIRCQHKKCGHEWYVAPDGFLRGTRCPQCQQEISIMKKRKTNEEFIKEVYALVGSEYEFLEEYINSMTKIKCKHNKCGHEYYVKPANFLFGKRCPQCAGNIKKTTEQFKQEIYDLVGDEYVFLEKYKGANTKIKCKHSKCGYEWDIAPSTFIGLGVRCPQCMRPNYNMDTTHFKVAVHSLVEDEYSVLGEYIKNDKKIKMKHNSCGHVFSMLPSNFLFGNRCPQCMRPNYYKNNDKFIEEVYSLVGNEYTFLDEYINNSTKLRCRHNTCGYEWDTRPANFLRGRRCPQCSESKGEQIIRKYLEDNNVKFLAEYTFDDLTGVGGGLLRFDFAVFSNSNDLEFLIEYDGEFHYQDIYEDGRFELQQVHDERKNQYCNDNNIPLLRIPYWDFNSVKKILDKWLIRYSLLYKGKVKQLNAS